MNRDIGRDNGATAGQLAREIGGYAAHDAPASALPRQLREAVVQLRLEGHHVCATPENGYFIAASAEELDALAKAIAGGYAHVDTLRREPLMAPLRAIPDFEETIAPKKAS